MSYLSDVHDLLRSARDELPAAELRALAGRILDEHRPALAALTEGSENYQLHDVLGLLGSAAQDFLDAAHDLDQVGENINRYVPDVFPTGRPPATDAVIEDWDPAERSVSVPHPARRHAPDGGGQGLDNALTKEWADAIATVLPARTSKRTTGICVLGDGSQIEVVSGRDQDANQADLILLNSPDFPRPVSPHGGLGTATHVETKIAYRMREQGITYAVVTINNVICDGMYSCKNAVKAILPRGYTLLVWEPHADRPIRLHGRAQP